MKLIILLAGLVIGAVGGAVGLLYWEFHNRVEVSDQMIFAPKSFYDSKQVGADALVAISGTLTGEGLGYPNNTYAVACYQEYKACFVSYVEQIGHDQIGRMETPAAYPIVKWDALEVVAQDEPSMFACRRVTITIERRTESLLWFEEPVNQSKPSCKDANTKISKYTIEDSSRWKQIHRP